RRSLAFRLLVANLVVVAVGAVALFATARLLGPHLFDSEVQRIGQRYGWSQGGGPGRGGGDGTAQPAGAIESDLRDAFTGSLDLALLVAIATGVVASAAAAAVVSKRLVRPISRMGTAVRNMAEGHYDQEVPEPGERELALLATDVNALGAALAGTEARRARLVSDLSHELRTPITALDGFVEGLEDGVFAPDDDILAAMRHETGRLRRLADDLGALSRTDEAAFDLRVGSADLATVAAAAARGLTAAFRSAGVEIVIEEMPDLPAMIDVDRMGQVFANLLRNALQHTPSGGTVTLSGALRGGSCVVAVSDTGAGIPPEHVDRVFDRFFRIDGDAGSAGGAGIGLTIARGIAAAHGGTITAASEGPHQGSTFTVTLPSATRPGFTASPPTAP
ncbi:MAG: HAMP domain-containing sensor histidine kinase, partial [Actinomycetota bacterium]